MRTFLQIYYPLKNLWTRVFQNEFKILNDKDKCLQIKILTDKRNYLNSTVTIEKLNWVIRNPGPQNSLKPIY